MKKKLLSLILTLPVLLLSACGALITEVYDYNIRYIHKFAAFSDDYVLNDETINVIREKKQAAEEKEFFLGLFYKNGSAVNIDKIKSHVKHHKADSVTRGDRTYTSPCTITQMNHRFYNIYEMYLRDSDSFKIEYENLRGGGLVNTKGGLIYHSYYIYQLDGTFKNLEKFFDGVEAYCSKATFVGWVDKKGNDIDFTSLKYNVKLYAKWSDGK